MWPKLAEHLGVAAAEYPGHAQPLEQQMAGMEAVWDKIVAKHNLQKNPLEAVVSWWHSDADLGRVIENFNDMTKSRDMGFTAYQNSVRSFTEDLRGEDSIAELCRKEGINQNLYYRWSKEFLEAGKKRLAGDTAREATSDEVKDPVRPRRWLGLPCVPGQAFCRPMP